MGKEMTAVERVVKQIADHVPVGMRTAWQDVGSQFVANPADVFLVFAGVEGTGAVDHQSTWTETVPDGCHNITLPFSTLLHILQGPVAHGSFILAKHPFARAGHIAEDEVEDIVHATEILGAVVGDQHIAPTPLADVLAQNPCPLWHDFVGDEGGTS